MRTATGRAWLCAALATFSLSLAAQAAELDLTLQKVLDQAAADENVSVLIYLNEQVDLDQLVADLQRDVRGRVPLSMRHETVVRALRAVAQNTQGSILDQLDQLVGDGQVSFYRAYWIRNCLRVDGTPTAIRALAARDDVGHVYYNYEIELDAPVRQEMTEQDKDPYPTRAPEPGVTAVRAPEVWNMGITGAGVLVATLDTGVDGNHPALASRWRGVADPRYSGHPDWAWFDPVTNTTFPQSFGSHGTHTMGTVCGGAPGDEIGVAPGAQWIHAAVIDRVDIPTTVADAIEAFQWMLDPDEDPATDWDVPDVCSNSWRVTDWHGYPPCDETFWTYLDACEAAGIVILFSAGNEGPSANTIGRPPDRATDEYRTFSVGAIDANTSGWPIADFSSRGPSYCTPDGSAAIKPEVVAPGVNVRSSVPGGGYESGWSGTSMASPHVNGVVALMREACPDLSPEEIKQILFDTAVDLGPTGEDNDYGWGMVDAYLAVQEALSLCSGAPRARDSHVDVPVNTQTTITLQATDYDGQPDPPGALTYIITTLPTNGMLTDPDNGYIITDGDLPYSLLAFGNQVIYTPATNYYGDDEFQFKANDGGTPPDGGDSNIATVSILVQYDAPTITTTLLPLGAADCPYGPFQMQADQGQPPLTWEVAGEGDYSETDLGSSQFATVGTARGWHADDSSWSYTLPFAFPFYGQTYTQAWICSNGFIDFTSNYADYSNSGSELMAAVRIAPLWDDLRTDYSGNDIFIDESVPGEVTIRWNCVTYAYGNSVNFSCTLYEDGRIRFHYGSGNTSLTPTVGISAGDNVYYLFSMYDGQPTLAGVNSVELAPPIPLPDGLTMSSDGVLSGTPTTAGTYAPRIRVTDALGRSDEVQLDLVILSSGPAGDLNGDGIVDLADLAILLANYGNSGMAYEDGDLDGDGDVDLADLSLLLSVYGSTC